MFKVLMALLLVSISLFASATTTEVNPDIIMTWLGFATLTIFVIGCSC